MAIGLGLMFGFTFVENFNYPYISRSITEFWHRWHISLSTWLRDYLFLPIAYSLSRRFDAHKLFGVQRDPVFWSYIIGTLATMSLAGLWHGPNWTFVVWGAVFGLFLVFERSRPGKRIKSLWPPLRHGYALIVIIAAWVVFRSDSLPAAFGYLRSMFGFATGDGKNYFPAMYLNNELIIVLCAALVGSMPVAKLVGRRFPATGVALPHTYRFARTLFTAFILIVSLLTLAGGTNNPFIYFRF